MNRQIDKPSKEFLEVIDTMKVIKCSIDGDSDLILQRITYDGRQCPSSVCQCSHQEQAEQEAYRDKRHDGQLYIPRMAVLRLINQAASRRGFRTEWDIKHYVRILDPHILLNHACSEVPITDYSIDSEAITEPRTGKPVLKHRPRLNDWGAMFRFCFAKEFVAPGSLKKLLVDVGKEVGLGAFTARGDGSFGRFTVTEWQETL